MFYVGVYGWSFSFLFRQTICRHFFKIYFCVQIEFRRVIASQRHFLSEAKKLYLILYTILYCICTFSLHLYRTHSGINTIFCHGKPWKIKRYSFKTFKAFKRNRNILLMLISMRREMLNIKRYINVPMIASTLMSNVQTTLFLVTYLW